MYSDVIDSLTWPVGEYRVDFAQFYDAADNFADTREGNALGEGVDLGSLSFTVVGTEADVTPPVLSSVSLLSKKTVTVGDRVRIAWSATDASDVEGVVFWVYAPDGRIKHVKTTTGHTKVGDTSSGVMYSDVIDSLTWPVGEYRVDFAQFYDAADNFADTREGNALGEGVDLGSLSFSVVEPTKSVSPTAVTFSDPDGTAHDTYTIPELEGIEYLIGDKVTVAGTYPGSGTIAVTARAKTDYVLTQGASAAWSHEFKATPYQVTPAAVVFTDKDGTAEDTFTVPVTEGVEYLVGETVTAAGTYPGSGTIAVAARAKAADYVLAEGASAGWAHSFKATPYQVTPAAVVFTDRDGTAEDAYTVPVTEGVEYLVGDRVTAAGTYPGWGTVTVTARAKADYVLADGATTEWSHEFKATPYPVTPDAVVFTDKDGTAEDTFTVPVTEGVEYLVGDKLTAAGTYPGSGTVTVTARAVTDYVLAPGAAAEWSHEFKATPFTVTPAAVEFMDRDGTNDDSYTIPVTDGVEYLVGETVTVAGTYPGTGTVTVTARATTDHVLADGATAEWSHAFKSTSAEYVPPAVSPFVDVSTAQQFYREMAWLAEQKISTGWDEGNGVRSYRPLQAINRDAMAAFLYRMAGSPDYAAPAVSPFADVSTGQQFYKEMAWLAEQKISTGWDEGNGVRTYRPLQAINRDAMAAFLYRMAGSPEYAAPAVSPFADVSTGQQFYKEMAWLAEQKISTGWDEGNGVRSYRPLQAINRDAMAAFLYRLMGLAA
ncbi:S-layer homology domain-containing protein [Arthrobacter sp. AK04]|uniref:S-layer homology domain-containing protein n=1 Tax=Arthrobacter sp. AK04 TaxID=2900048 RepID=UPI001E43DEAE|nr:S-layer homology domain-containing protein [Arthrobacter sp. AK04]MCD5343514.1 S-layer homology domain-containing protein [Arthrobacter sp. AK04]